MLLLKVPLVNGHHLLYAMYSRLLLGDFIVHYFSGAIADVVVVFFFCQSCFENDKVSQSIMLI